MMTKLLFSFSLIGLLLGLVQAPAIAKTMQESAAEVIAVKDLGLSDRDESRSVIEVRWRVISVPKEKIVSFNLVLSITYANGSTISINRKIVGNELSARVEVPSVRSIGGRHSAFIKKMEARVTPIISKN